MIVLPGERYENMIEHRSCLLFVSLDQNNVKVLLTIKGFLVGILAD